MVRSLPSFLGVALAGVVLVGGALVYERSGQVTGSAVSAPPERVGVIEPVTLRASYPGVLSATSAHPTAPDPKTSSWQYSAPLRVPEDVVVRRIETRVIGAPPEILHHLALVRVGVPNAVCGKRGQSHAGIDELFVASRHSLTDVVDFPEPHGIALAEGDQLVLEFMEHTPLPPYGPGGTYERPQLEVTLVPDTRGVHDVPLEFVRLRLDDTPCAEPVGHQAFAVAAGTEVTRRSRVEVPGESYTFAKDSIVLTRGANFWPLKGGQRATLYLNETVRDTFVAQQGGEPWRYHIPPSEEPLFVRAGDTVTYEVRYENPYDREVPDASGMLGFYVAPAADL